MILTKNTQLRGDYFPCMPHANQQSIGCVMTAPAALISPTRSTPQHWGRSAKTMMLGCRVHDYYPMITKKKYPICIQQLAGQGNDSSSPQSSELRAHEKCTADCEVGKPESCVLHIKRAQQMRKRERMIQCSLGSWCRSVTQLSLLIHREINSGGAALHELPG